MKRCFMIVVGVVCCCAAGCRTPTRNIDPASDTAGAVAAIDYRDLGRVAGEMLQSLMASGKLARTDGTKHVLAVGKVKNDTMQRFDTDTLTAQIIEEISGSGTVLVTAAVAAGADGRDDMVDATRALRGDAEVKQDTVAAPGQLVPPTLSLSGKIVQKEVRMDNGDKQIEYYFQLRLVEIATGIQEWQKQVFVGKRTDKRTPTW